VAPTGFENASKGMATAKMPAPPASILPSVLAQGHPPAPGTHL
jgi:hypothetical protein